MDHIVITGGNYHDFEGTSAVLARRFETLGLQTQTFGEPEEALRALAAAPQCRLLTVNALRFTMVQNEKYAPFRAKWAFTLSDEGRRIMSEYVRGGGALLGLHTASICFDGWPEWRAILGAQWRWGTSFHPPTGPVHVEALAADEPLTAGAPAFDVYDEVYHHLDLDPAARALLRARTADGEFQPVMWAHQYGRGRAIYDSLGHGVDSVDEPTHRMILNRAVAWLLGREGGVAHA
jgi:type 1 glutamine amidotransferase